MQYYCNNKIIGACMSLQEVLTGIVLNLLWTTIAKHAALIYQNTIIITHVLRKDTFQS